MKVGSQLYLTPEEAICTCRQKIDISEYEKHFMGLLSLCFLFRANVGFAEHK